VSDYTLVLADAVKFLERLPGECVDLCITDPAYESLEKHRAIGTTTRLTNAWFPIFPNSRYPELFAQLFRVMKRDTHLYAFCDAETMFVLKPIGEAAGFKFWKPLVWDKVAIGMGYHYRARHEYVLFFEKGSKQLSDLSMPDVLTAKRVRGGYPTEKPLSVLTDLISQSSQPEQLVLDCFMGSGSTGDAACRLGRHFIGCDVSEESLTRTYLRLQPLGYERKELPRGQPSLL
jgi:site-specific DNA-methyltransferase (adenine-specific)